MLLLIDSIPEPLGDVNGEQCVHRHHIKDLFDENKLSSTGKHAGSPTRKLAVHIVEEAESRAGDDSRWRPGHQGK